MSKTEKIITISIVIILVIVGFFIKHQIDYSKEFSSTEWKQLYSNFNIHLDNDELDASDAYWDLAERKKMVKSLIKSKQLLGKTKKEVIEILGQEDNDFESDRWSYWLYFTAVDNGWLVLTFNEDGVVDNVFKYED